MNPGTLPFLTELPSGVALALVALVGLCIGSFLNVVISRLPAGLSVVRPGSHCACGAPIPWHLNIPVVSWLALRGHAKCCGRPISWRYPAVELLTAVAFVLCWRRFPGDPGTAACGWVLASSLIAAAVIDWEHLIIPEPLTLGLGVIGVLLSVLHPSLHRQFDTPFFFASLRSAGVALTGLAVGSGLLLWIAALATTMLKREAMGMGDVIFVGAIGAFCGWHGAVFAIFGGAAVGALLAPLILLRGSSGLKEARLPFGPMLAIAGAAYFLGLSGPVDAWFAHSAALFN
jgi:leader peptidase (prepilin peptidase)/N-methyltransferase